MTRFKDQLLVATGFVILIGAVTLESARVGQSAPAVDRDVRVINVPSEPVPTSAQGTTAVSGTVQAQQSGLWSVGISTASNSVQVGNAVSAPVPTRDVDNAARGAFQRQINVTIPDGEAIHPGYVHRARRQEACH